MRRETQNVLLVLVGGALVKIVLDGTYLRYVKPWSGPVVLAAGIVIVALAAVAIVRDVRTGATPDEQAGEDGHGPPWAVWLMLLPVLAILLVAPPALGSSAVTGAAARAAPVGDAEEGPLPPGDAPALAVVDAVARAAADPRGPLTRRDITLTGFLVPATRAPTGRAPGTDLARLVISCCAADASAVRVHLDDPGGVLAAGGDPPAGSGDRWVQVRGRVVPDTGTPADGHIPTLRLTGSSPVAPPSPVYEY